MSQKCPKAAPEQDAAIFLTAAFTGLRQGELVALRWRDVDFAGSYIRVTASYTNGELSTPKKRQGPIRDDGARGRRGARAARATRAVRRAGRPSLRRPGRRSPRRVGVAAPLPRCSPWRGAAAAALPRSAPHLRDPSDRGS